MNTAMLLLKDACKINPFVLEPHLVLAQIYLTEGEYELAKVEATEGLRLPLACAVSSNLSIGCLSLGCALSTKNRLHKPSPMDLNNPAIKTLDLLSANANILCAFQQRCRNLKSQRLGSAITASQSLSFQLVRFHSFACRHLEHPHPPGKMRWIWSLQIAEASGLRAGRLKQKVNM